MTNELTTQTIDPMLQMIERVALDPNADVSKLEKLIELSERVSDRQAKADFDNVHAIQDMPFILTGSQESKINAYLEDIAKDEMVA